MVLRRFCFFFLLFFLGVGVLVSYSLRLCVSIYQILRSAVSAFWLRIVREPSVGAGSILVQGAGAGASACLVVKVEWQPYVTSDQA